MNMRDWGSNIMDFLKTFPVDSQNKELISSVFGILWYKKQNFPMIQSPNQEAIVKIKRKREVLAVFLLENKIAGRQSFAIVLRMHIQLMFISALIILETSLNIFCIQR